MLPPPSHMFDLAFRRLSAQTVARENARTAWHDLARGQRELREVQEFLDAHVDERTRRHSIHGLPRQRRG